MFRSVLSKVAWVGRTTSMVFGLALVLALLFGVASMAFAANGQSFILGSLKNSATAVSRLTMTGTANGSVLQLIQQSTGTGASGLGITVPTGRAPITVNSAAGKATNLDADKLDSLDSTALQRRVSGTCAAGQSISSIGVAGTVTCETDDDSGAALRSELGTSDMEGPNQASDPVSYTKVKDIPADVVNRNAATLQGKTASEFAPAAHTHSGADITSGTVSEARIDGAVARDGEVMPIVQASDGAASGLDADKLDGKEPNQLPGTIASFGSFAGLVTSIAGGSGTWVFAGPTATVTTSTSQRLFGAAQAPLGLSSGGPQFFDYGLCYQPGAGGVINNFVGNSYSTAQITTTRASYPATATVVPGSGTWNVGFCVRNTGAATISNNDWVNGWVQVVN